MIYIVKENRTYDQVLGDLGKGNGDPSLTLFNEKSSPNHHKLAREFVLFDNFYVNADVSADGHNWSTSAIAPDYVQKMWPNSYARPPQAYDYEGGEPSGAIRRPDISGRMPLPPDSHAQLRLVGDECAQGRRRANRRLQAFAIRILAKVTNMNYPGFDLDYPGHRPREGFLDDLQEFETDRKMPRLMLLRLGNDHTSGTAAGKIAPLIRDGRQRRARSGMIVEAVSKASSGRRPRSSFSKTTRRMDPITSTRTAPPLRPVALYTAGGFIDSTMYNTTSMLRTMELILGLRPMTHFDAGCAADVGAFSQSPIRGPMQRGGAHRRSTNETRHCTATAAGSARLDFTEADEIDDDELNDILWRAIGKPNRPRPSEASSRADAAHLRLLPLAHAPALLQGPGDRRVQAAVDANARAEGLLRHGEGPRRLSRNSSDLQSRSFDARADRGVCERPVPSTRS